MGRSQKTLTVAMSADYRAWWDRLREVGGYPSDAAAFDAAVKLLAAEHDQTPPPRAHPVGYNGPERSGKKEGKG